MTLPPLFGPDFPSSVRDPLEDEVEVYWYHPDFTQSRYPPGRKGVSEACTLICLLVAQRISQTRLTIGSIKHCPKLNILIADSIIDGNTQHAWIVRNGLIPHPYLNTDEALRFGGRSLSTLKEWRPCETPPSPTVPVSVGIKNCNQLFSPLLVYMVKRKVSRSANIMSADRKTFLQDVNARIREKSCLQFFLPTALFNMLLRACETLWSAREIASLALSADRERHTENVFHMLLRACETTQSKFRVYRESIEKTLCQNIESFLHEWYNYPKAETLFMLLITCGRTVLLVFQEHTNKVTLFDSHGHKTPGNIYRGLVLAQTSMEKLQYLCDWYIEAVLHKRFSDVAEQYELAFLYKSCPPACCNMNTSCDCGCLGR